MTEREELRRGWCPTAFRPMMSGDGLLLRIRPEAGSLPVAALKLISEVAQRFGSGDVELTNRANVQIRGLRAETLAAAQAELVRAGLADSEHPDLPNVAVDPLSGIDPESQDVSALADAFEAALKSYDDLARIPPKFGYAISGEDGGMFGAADILISATKAGACLRLDGDAGLAAGIERDEVIAATLRLTGAFLALRRQHADLRRMRDAVAAFGARMLFESAGVTEIQYRAADHVTALAPGLVSYGPHASALVIGLPFGAIDAATLCELCDAAEASGVNRVRISTARSLIFHSEQASALAALLEKSANLGLVIDPADPRASLHACPGAPKCANATTQTRIDARLLAEAFATHTGKVSDIHVSGCPKGCAHGKSAAWTLVARDGLYDLVRDGTVADKPVLTGLTPAQLAGIVTTNAPEHAA